MDKLLVPYQLALQLQEKGFDATCDSECFKYWIPPHLNVSGDAPCLVSAARNSYFDNSALRHYGVPAPLYQQVIDWLREKHNIVVELSYASNIQGESGFKYHLRLSTNYNSKIGLVFPYYEALEKAITESLKLIGQSTEK